MEAKARYLDWRNEEDEKSGPSFNFRKNVLRRDPAPDYRKAFDGASESLEGLFAFDLSTLSDRSLREDIDNLNRARPSFKDDIIQDSGVRRITITVLGHFGGIDQISSHSLYIIKMLWEIRRLIASFAEEQQCVCLFGQGCSCGQVCSRSIATVLNTLGARLLHAINTISSSMLAGQFMEALQDEADSMKPEKAIYCVLHQQDEFPHLHHHNKLFGFSFSQHTCRGRLSWW